MLPKHFGLYRADIDNICRTVLVEVHSDNDTDNWNTTECIDKVISIVNERASVNLGAFNSLNNFIVVVEEGCQFGRTFGQKVGLPVKGSSHFSVVWV